MLIWMLDPSSIIAYVSFHIYLNVCIICVIIIHKGNIKLFASTLKWTPFQFVKWDNQAAHYTARGPDFIKVLTKQWDTYLFLLM